MNYRPEIDGLRAVAVMPVVFYHAGFEFFRGGFVGVDIFFVISGYLMAKIVVGGIEANDFSLLDFFARRARRIVPALAAMTIATLCVGWLTMNPQDLSDLGNAAIGVATFTSNFVFWQSQGYFEQSAELNPLLHTWSLAIEEQYYLIFPIVVLLIWKFARGWLHFCILLLVIFSLFASEIFWRIDPIGNFYLLPTRAWELFAGALAALYLRRHGSASSELLAVAGLTLIVISVVGFDESFVFPSFYTLVPVVGTMLVLVFANQAAVIARLLHARLLVGIGLISYSIYLWHQPVFAFLRRALNTVELEPFVAMTTIIGVLLLSALSWRLIEQPFRRQNTFTARRIFAISMGLFLVIGSIGMLSRATSEGVEYRIAKALGRAPFVEVNNMDERRFMDARLSLAPEPGSDVLMGSSRLMQAGTQTVGAPVLNLSVSGASVEDLVAFVGAGTAELRPERVFIGLDPWLFNKNAGQKRWRSVIDRFEHWKSIMQTGVRTDQVSDTHDQVRDSESSLVGALASLLYDRFNSFGSFAVENGDNGIKGKIARDGFRIYSKAYLEKNADEIEMEFDGLLRYAMRDFEQDSSKEHLLRTMAIWLLEQNIAVYFVLSPYHPDLYNRMVTEKPIFIEIEHHYRNLADDLNVKLIGSYDPQKTDCNESDFYDGMHPKEDCMKRIFATVHGS